MKKIWKWIKSKKIILIIITLLLSLTYASYMYNQKRVQVNDLVSLVNDYNRILNKTGKIIKYHKMIKEFDAIDLTKIPYGKVIYLHGVPEFKNDGLTALDTLSRYDYFDVGIFSPTSLKIYKIRIPAYAQGAFGLGNWVGIKPKSNEKEEKRKEKNSNSNPLNLRIAKNLTK